MPTMLLVQLYILSSLTQHNHFAVLSCTEFLADLRNLRFTQSLSHAMHTSAGTKKRSGYSNRLSNWENLATKRSSSTGT